MNLQTIENGQSEQKLNSDSKADNIPSAQVSANALVGCRIMSYDFFRKNCELNYKTISNSRYMFLKTNGFKKLTGDDNLVHGACYRNWGMGQKRETPLQAVTRYKNEYFGDEYKELVYYSIDKCNVDVYGR